MRIQLEALADHVAADLLRQLARDEAIHRSREDLLRVAPRQDRPRQDIEQAGIAHPKRRVDLALRVAHHHRSVGRPGDAGRAFDLGHHLPHANHCSSADSLELIQLAVEERFLIDLIDAFRIGIEIVERPLEADLRDQDKPDRQPQGQRDNFHLIVPPPFCQRADCHHDILHCFIFFLVYLLLTLFFRCRKYRRPRAKTFFLLLNHRFYACKMTFTLLYHSFYLREIIFTLFDHRFHDCKVIFMLFDHRFHDCKVIFMLFDHISRLRETTSILLFYSKTSTSLSL